ncbi:hypothetical protein Taro_015612 [Colocasia esculenta]|uniref:Uncharacterized protein n=1 Tax=Colocasia esculenta TaxID=4460 RepID=A0A843UMP6_COLES|nr:hypothetical protein [Colocasia esculenta]
MKTPVWDPDKIAEVTLLPEKSWVRPCGAEDGKDSLTVRASCPTRWSRTHVTSMKWRALSWPENGRDVRESQEMTGMSHKARKRLGCPRKPENDMERPIKSENGRDVQESHGKRRGGDEKREKARISERESPRHSAIAPRPLGVSSELTCEAPVCSTSDVGPSRALFVSNYCRYSSVILDVNETPTSVGGERSSTRPLQSP